MEKPSSGAEQHDGGLRIGWLALRSIAHAAAEKRLHGFKKRSGFEDHTFATAKRTVVDAAMLVFGKFAQVLNVYVDEFRLPGAPENSVIERAAEKFREDGDKVKAHALPV